MANEKADLKAMEASSSSMNPAPAFRSNFASLSLHMTDRIRMLEFPPETMTLIQNTIKESWVHGIQESRDYHGSSEIKMVGNPWRGHSDQAIHARRLMQKLLENLYNAGWIMYLSTDVSKKQMDLDSLIFRCQDPVPTPCQWLTIAFSKLDRLRFLDAPQEVVGDMMNDLGEYIQSHSAHKIAGVYEFKIKGWPWSASGGETVRVRMMILKMLGVLERHGFTVYASIDQKTGPGGKLIRCSICDPERSNTDDASSGDSTQTETDTWFCTRPLNWTSGLPVYHA